jgi:hypothetical protein
MSGIVKYPKLAAELRALLANDQTLWRGFWKENYKKQNELSFKADLHQVELKQHENTLRMLEILDEIRLPRLSNIGPDASQAVSILALHDSLTILSKVLNLFIESLTLDKDDTFIQAIPSMTDRLLILKRKPQRFGKQWEGNGLTQPFLPTVEDFEHINSRRSDYGIEPLRWPKSLAIPEEEQPWLRLPISELVTRDISD